MRTPLLLFGMIGVLLLSACKAPESVVYQRIENLRISRAQGQEVELLADVVVFNPNKYAVKVWEVAGNCMINNRPAGSLRLDTITSLPGKADASIPVRASVQTAGLLGNGLQLLLGGELPYSFEGKAKAGRGKWKWNIPISQSGLLNRKQLEGLLN